MVGVSASFAAQSAPPWEPDANAAAPYGSLSFYDAAGNQLTSGTGDLSSPFAYVVASTAADPRAVNASVYFANPQSGVVPGNWTAVNDEAGPTLFSPSLSGAPADIAAMAPTYPVTASSAANISSFLTGVGTVNLPTAAGYANTIQVRMTDSGPRGAGNSSNGSYWESDIGYNTTSSPITVDGTTVPADGWAVLYPFLSNTITTLTVSPSGGQLTQGQSLTLTATESPTVSGSVQFYDGSTLLNTSTTPGSGTYTYTYTPALGTHSYSATFVPASGPGSTAFGVTVQVVSTPTVTVTNFSPTGLGQGASNIGVTLTGSAFVTGASVKVAGISFSSVRVVDSTTITAKATVASSAKVGNATVIVTDSVGSGSCTTCLTIVAGPTVKSITPPSVTSGASESVTIAGTGYVNGATVTGPAGVTFSKTKVVTSKKITATIKVTSGAKAGKHLPVTVINGVAGGEGHGTGNVLTIVAAPAAKSISGVIKSVNTKTYALVLTVKKKADAFKATSSTRVRINGKTSSFKRLKKGEAATVDYTVKGKVWTAISISAKAA